MTLAKLSRRATALLVGLILLTSSPVMAAPECRQGQEVRIWTAPLAPEPGYPLEVFAVATDGALEQVTVSDPAGQRSRLRTLKSGGPPWSLYGTVFRPSRGTYRIEVIRNAQTAACAEVRVGFGNGERGSGEWDLASEALYSAWIEHLFNAPAEQSLSFKSLAPLLRDPGQNFLYDYLGTREDEQLPAEPDCADLPYFLRAYFAWKLGLPIAYRRCSRGSRARPPSCESPVVDTRFTATLAPLDSFRQVGRDIMNSVHSGSGRTALSDDATDFYPVALERASLWPGTIYADPYGHILVLVKWIPQRERQSGLLLAVDAQPDNSVTRKRYWEGNFLFAHTPSAGPGFKRFRPLTQTGGTGARALPNAALDGRSGLPAFSSEQSRLEPADFHARMERLINPRGLDPSAAYESTLDALMEQLETRVTSVANGERYMRAHPGTVPMPSGPAIFETTGPWEDYATPSRDMRLLIAMKVLAGLPERIRRYPRLYVLSGEDASSAAARIEQLHAQRLQERAIEYARSDGSPWRLTLDDIDARRAALEMAYNPNDCIEIRWGASAGTQEGATCQRRAPREQRARMEQYRPWFRDTTRPPR